MTQTLNPIRPVDFAAPPQPNMSVGARPRLYWVSPDELVVDARYQRDIGKRGAANVRQIVEHFDWTKFGVLTCVRVAAAATGGVAFAVVDGQHRATAALMHPRVEEVPCWVTEASFEDQARAFVAINSAVTRITAMQMFHAATASGDPEAVAAERACAKAGVTVMRYPVSRTNLKPGETIAAGALRTAVKRQGEGPLRIALTALAAQDAEGGLVNATTVNALASLVTQLDWRRRESDVLAELAALDLPRMEDDAEISRRDLGGGAVWTHLLTALRAAADFAALKPKAARRGTGSY